MNNKGFTLTEVLAGLIIISVVLIVVSKQIGKTLSVTKNETYDLMKRNIIKASEIYLKECMIQENKCTLEWEENKTTFNAHILKEYGYYTNFKSPIDNKELDNCLTIIATKNNGVIKTKIKDEFY